MKKSLICLGTTVLLLTSAFAESGNVYAKGNNEKKLSETYEINWTEAWEEVENLNESTGFGSTNTPGEIGVFAYGDLASGSTGVAAATISSVESTGKTTGKILSTVTSATTSIQNVRLDKTVYGSKGIAIGKFTSSSTAAINLSSTYSLYVGLSIHTATNSGVLFESKTAANRFY